MLARAGWRVMTAEDAWRELPNQTRGDSYFGDSRMAHAIQHFDWSQTNLGPIDRWPASLASLTRTILSANHAMCISWGENLTHFQ